MEPQAGTDPEPGTDTALQTALRRIEDARAEEHGTLALSGLGLSDLPDELRAVIGLRELDLSDNELTVLPPWIATFPHLRVLDLRRNRLVEVPWQLGTLALSALELEGNPHLLLPPPETVAQGTEAVLAHLRASAPLSESDDAASEAALVVPGLDASENAEPPNQAPHSEASATGSGPLSGTASRVAAVSGAAVLLLAAVGVAAAVGSSGGGSTHQAAGASTSGPGAGTTAGLAVAGLAGVSSPSTPLPTTPDGSVTTVTAAAPPPAAAAHPPVVTVTATATATATAGAPPVVQTSHLPGTPAPTSTTAVKVFVTKTVAPAPTTRSTKPVPPPPPSTTAVKEAPVQSGPFAVSVASATGQLIGNGGMCVDDYASNTADYSEVDLWDCNGTGAQNWSWVASGTTLHVLGLCLDVKGGGTSAGTTVDLYQCNGTGAQVFIPRSDGSLFNPQSGKCLDDPNGSTNRGTALQIWDCNGTASQRWQLP